MLSLKTRFFNSCFIFVIILFVLKSSAADKPNIIFILADDLGWNDVGFHGSGQVPTPNIDSLAYSGLILNNYYVAPICTPSRSALMTGKLPIHTGMQHTVLFGAEPRGLPLGETLLPERLRAQGYTTRLVGKWHLGSYKLEYTPLYRGFDSHLGFWTGHHDYFDHTAMEKPGWGLDMRRNTELAYDLHGQYSTDIFSKEAVRLISTHNNTKPLFLYLAHAAVHSGNPYNPLPAPDNIVSKFDYIQNYNRRRFAAVLTKLDESVGMVVDALGKRGMLKNSIIVFSTDNGGPAEGFNLNAASNWPLRGVKNTLWEGGVRGAGLLWSPLIKKSKRVADQAMHISDWLPTLYNAAGGDTSDLGKIDGYNLWPALSNDDSSPRIETLHNIDDIYGSSAITVGEWKMVKGTNYNGIWDSWYGPSGREVNYNITMVKNSLAGRALQKINQAASHKDIVELRKIAEVQCARNITSPSSSSSASNHRCQPLMKPCLFHVASDPCELNNLAEDFPEILLAMENTLQDYNRTAVRPGNKPLDPRGDPRFWEYTWTNFGDYSFKNNLLIHS